MIQISEEKKENLTEMCEKMLHYGGKMMQCLESLEDGDEAEEGRWMRHGMRDGHRSGMRRGSMRGGYRNEEYPEDYEGMGTRRGGRRSRYDGEW